MMFIVRFFAGLLVALVLLFFFFYVPVSGQTAWQRIQGLKNPKTALQTQVRHENTPPVSKSPATVRMAREDHPPMEKVSKKEQAQLDRLIADKTGAK